MILSMCIGIVLVFKNSLMRSLFSQMRSADFFGILMIRSVSNTDRLSFVCPSTVVGAGTNVKSTERVHNLGILIKP